MSVTSWGDVEAACAALPFDEATRLFMPRSDGGALGRSRSFPAPDSHADARAVCARCPVISQCLMGGLRHDAWTFRGGLSPEERAAFGGHRDPDVARRRGVYLSRPQVWSRLLFSPVPAETIRAALTRWRRYLHTGDEGPLGIGDFAAVGGAGQRSTPHEVASADPTVRDADDWFVEHVPAARAGDRGARRSDRERVTSAP